MCLGGTLSSYLSEHIGLHSQDIFVHKGGLWGRGLPSRFRGSGLGFQEPHQGGQSLWTNAGGLIVTVAWDKEAHLMPTPQLLPLTLMFLGWWAHRSVVWAWELSLPLP